MKKSYFMNLLVGKKLKTLRKSRGYSIEEIIQKLNLSKSTYERMEKGETSSWVTKIESICTLYQIEPEELVLPEEKYNLIKKQNNVLNKDSNINLSEKMIELYERLLEEKNKKIAELENKLKIDSD